MNLESPAALGLAAIIPAILLLWVLKPRRPRLRVPSLMLWPESPAQRQSARPWQRLRNHPLLWLQLLAAALLVTAAARPFLPADQASRHLVVLLDASGSMAATDVAPSRFEAARSAVMELARGMGPDQEITLIRVDAQPRALVAGAKGAAQLEIALGEEGPSHDAPDLAAALALAAGLTTGPAEWVMVSDGGLALPEGATRPAGTGFRSVVVGTDAGNVAATGLSLRQGEAGVSLQAGLRNTGPTVAEGNLQLLAEGRLVSAQPWRLEPGAERFVSWSSLPAGPRWYEVRLAGVEAGSNALAADDRAWAAVSAPSQPEVLLVTPGSGFLERVLSTQDRVRAFRASPKDLPGLAAQGKSYPLTILDRTVAESPPAGNLLLVGPTQGVEFRPQQVWPRPDNPLLRHVDWSEVRVGAARALPADAGWRPVVDSDGGPLVAIRESDGRREAVIAFDLSMSDLPLRPAFPVLISNLLEWLLPSSGSGVIVLGESGSASVDPLPLAREVWAEGPGGERTDLAPPWPPLAFRPPEPGLYRVIQGWDGGQEESLLVAGGYRPQEADLAPATVDLPAADGESGDGGRGSLALWPWLAVALVGVSIAEWWVDSRGR